MDITEENKCLRQILGDALKSPDSQEWKDAASKVLSVSKQIAHGECGHKWEGESCSYCKHSINVHAKGGGMCFAANCGCNEFVKVGA